MLLSHFDPSVGRTSMRAALLLLLGAVLLCGVSGRSLPDNCDDCASCESECDDVCNGNYVRAASASLYSWRTCTARAWSSEFWKRDLSVPRSVKSPTFMPRFFFLLDFFLTALLGLELQRHLPAGLHMYMLRRWRNGRCGFFFFFSRSHYSYLLSGDVIERSSVY